MNFMKTSLAVVACAFLATCAPAMAEVGLSGFELIKGHPSVLFKSDTEQIDFAQDIAPSDGDRNSSFELYALQGDPYSQIVELDFEPQVLQVHFTNSPPSLHIHNSKCSNVRFEVGWLNS